MAQTPQQTIELIKRMVISILFVSGTMLFLYNVTAFRVDKFGLYYKDGNQLWLAIGATLLVVGWLIRNWKKLL